MPPGINYQALKFLLKLFFRFLGLLPFPLLYFLSDILFFFLFYIAGYRRKVVHTNLANAFPEKTAKERRRIEKKFFRHLCDIILESAAAIQMSKRSLQKRCKIKDTPGYRHYLQHEGASLVLTGHFGNWEWAGLAIGLATPRPLEVVYLKQKSSATNRLISDIRSRFGNGLANMEQTYKHIVERQHEGLVTCILADQTPQKHRIGYWTEFLNQDTPFFGGMEKIARRLKLNVYFGRVVKVKRGHYEIEMRLISSEPEKEPENYITEKYARLAEEAIREQPETWLWSHKRWKHSRPAEKKEPA